MLPKILLFIMLLSSMLIGAEDIYAPGVIVTKFKRGVVDLSLYEQGKGLEAIKDTSIRRVLLSYGFIELKKAIPGFSPSETLTTLENGEVVKVPDFSRVFTLHFPATTNIFFLSDTLNKLSGVEWAHLDLCLNSYAAPNDPLFPQQWALTRISCDGAWNYEKGKSSVRMAIIDVGVKYDHPDLGNGFGAGFKIAGGGRLC